MKDRIFKNFLLILSYYLSFKNYMFYKEKLLFCMKQINNLQFFVFYIDRYKSFIIYMINDVYLCYVNYVS